MSQGEIANRFIMKGKDLNITYETTSISGQPQLIYKSSKADVTFGAKDIRQSSTEIGQEVTVTIGKPTPDLGRLTLTLLLPPINLEGKETSFEAIATHTTHLDSFVGPQLVKGALKTYDVEKLAGTASKVIFVKKP